MNTGETNERLPGEDIGKPTECAHCHLPLPADECEWRTIETGQGLVAFCSVLCKMDEVREINRRRAQQADEGEEWKR